MERFKKSSAITHVSFGGLIITLGIVYGDIGTSPLYVLKAIISGLGVINEQYILGSVSCIIWTLTLQTTVKYVIITIRADNKGEGGILSLFALLRRKVSWVYIFAIIGGATMLADGIITPSITVTSAIEGLKLVSADIPVLTIVIVIITILFFVQQFGTKLLGKSFGPIMVVWFIMLAFFGLIQIIKYPVVLYAFNPYYAYSFLVEFKGGFIILGAVFLCTTGAEALYTDLGHCGLKNIRITWVFVKTSLIINYLGQAAFALSHPDIAINHNPFFAIMPESFLLTGIIIATLAAIIASQAMITGSYTLISEAVSLNLWPRVTIQYPTNVKGQMYVPSINWLLYFSCIAVILYFKESSNMEAAYGLSITITMIMTTFLLLFYLRLKNINIFLIILFAVVYFFIQGAFLIANLFKFSNGGWITILIAGTIALVMYIWYNGRKIRNRLLVFMNIGPFLEILRDVSADKNIPKHATHLVMFTRANNHDKIESKIIYSLINKPPKRADRYWLIHVDITEDPHQLDYEIKELVPGVVQRIDFRIGFKVQPHLNLYFKHVIDDLGKSGEFDMYSPYESLRKHYIHADIKFLMIERILNYDFKFKVNEQFVIEMYYYLKYLSSSTVKTFGLDTSNVEVEKVPLSLHSNVHEEPIRVFMGK